MVGGVTGFVVGVISSIPEAAGELGKVIVNAWETVIGYTTYDYDEKGRIRYMKLYPPIEHAEELVKTEFLYSGDDDIPVKTEVCRLGYASQPNIFESAGQGKHFVQPTC